MASSSKTTNILQLPSTILLIFLCFCTTLITSHSSEPAEDYNRWLSWNIRNHAKKTKTSISLQQQIEPSLEGNHNSTQVVDVKLREAEVNRYRIIVSHDGSANYTTISAAIDSIPRGNKRRAILEIRPGVYREKISIPRTLPFVTLLGDWNDQPTITGNDTASGVGKDGMPLKTFQSATVAVEANYFVAINIKFENTASHEIGRIGEQAVAFRISGTKAAFYNCSFYGSQDTLYDHKGLHYFHNCFIQGSVDFIFGHARSLYEKCELNSIGRKVRSLTAQKRSNSSLESGFSFKDSVVTGSGESEVYLGRAWGDYSRVVYSFTFMDKIVHPQGWNDWGHHNRDFRVYYGEYKCSGPGANSTARVPWARMLTDDEALPFIGTYYVDGDSWLISPPSTYYS